MLTEEEMRSTFARNLRKYMDLTGSNQPRIAQIAGVSQQAVSSWLNARRMPRMGVVEKLAEYFGIMKSDLLEDKDRTDVKNILPIPETKRIPMIGRISCGVPSFAEQDFSYVDGPIKADFCLTAEGDSMIGARIRDGDLVFCKAQPAVDDGEIAAVIIDDTATLKRFYYYPEKSMVILRSENPDFKDQIYIGDELQQMRIIGKAIAFQSTIR